MTNSPLNAYETLGVDADASQEDVRSAYLKLVRQYPPDRHPDQFQKIHAAYQLLNDPLMQAKALFNIRKHRPNLLEVIANAEKIRPRLPKLVLLALGNQSPLA